MLHLIKLCVGVESLEELARWQKQRLAEKKKKGPDMTDQMNGQVPLLPGPPGVAAPPGADSPRRCKQPGSTLQVP